MHLIIQIEAENDTLRDDLGNADVQSLGILVKEIANKLMQGEYPKDERKVFDQDGNEVGFYRLIK